MEVNLQTQGILNALCYEKTEVSLLQYFKSVNAIKEASREELAKAIGPAKGNVVYDYFHSAVS